MCARVREREREREMHDLRDSTIPEPRGDKQRLAAAARPGERGREQGRSGARERERESEKERETDRETEKERKREREGRGGWRLKGGGCARGYTDLAKTGAMRWQGPHHFAVKSTRTSLPGPQAARVRYVNGQEGSEK